MDEENGWTIGLAPFAHVQLHATTADYGMNLHLDSPFPDRGCDDRRLALEQMLSRALKKSDRSVEICAVELGDGALPVCGRADGSPGRGNEGSDLSHELGEGWLFAKEDMICAVKVHKARSGYASR
jgi:hypothetical protein